MHGLKFDSHDSEGKSKKLDHLTQYVFKYMGKSIIFENSFDDENFTDVMLSSAYLVFHSQIFKKFKPFKRQRRVKKMKDGTYRTFSLGRGSYSLWDSSRGLKKIMQMDKKNSEGKNCLGLEMLNEDSEKTISVYKTVNEDLLGC